ncbi:hypothetical protein GE21DRAFT_7825 [Neurospora crassa]|uniref:Uncharacterized protein n=2 Tax=Neurospora crassa TaxID=5141 RepID=Q1K6Z4_NEUCR|nr:hypothetical protein NCU01391 [Neurospora crassa OR74A]EAA31712.1 hypothetical protein NCU01391 [Neurospora crassa OR74A]KHE80843.1 hypothetical protein GE21DRAFT_7825 [Neurospora crassa]CAD70865.1 putative protein [Neurospora crassa]|eukprot:XP_960948.1 hypothetical protein NCU01391 [Neurospora crassa OR74A]
MSAAAQNSAYSITMSPPPPFDLGSYSRSMHQHTKRQMEAASQTNLPRSSGSPSNNQNSNGQSQSNATPSLPNGVSGTRSRNSSEEYSYQS